MSDAVLHFDIRAGLTSSVDTDGYISVQVDGLGEQNSSIGQYDAFPTNGVYHRPLDAELDGSGNVVPSKASIHLVMMEGGRGYTINLGDPRAMALIPQTRP